MISSQQISALIAAQQQQLQILQGSLPSQVPMHNIGASSYPPSFSYGYSGAPPGSRLSSMVGGGIGALPVALGAAQTGAGIASMFGVSNAATSLLAPQFGAGAAGVLAGAAVPAATLALVSGMANNAARGMQEFSGTQAILSQMRFANPAAATGRGFTTQQQLGMYNMMSRVDAADPFTSMGDVQSMLRGFNDMKMSQGIRDAQEFSDRFKKMTETIKDMAKMMGTTIEGAMQSFGEMRRSGFISGSELRGNVMDMMVAQGRGIDQGQFLGAQRQGSAMLRAKGMTGRFGARMVSGVSSAVMGGMQRGLYSGEDLMDIFDTSSAGEASLQFGTELTQSISNFMMTGRGQAFLAATAERGPGGKFTGKLSQQRLSEVLGSGNLPDVLASAGASIQGAGRESALSFVNSKVALADQFMSRDSAYKDIVDMVRQYAERSGQPGDDMTKLLLKKFLEVDDLRAEKLIQLAKDYETEATAKRDDQMRELSAQQVQRKMRLLTGSGIKAYISGTLADLGGPIRRGAAGLSAEIQTTTQNVLDAIGGIDRSAISSFDLGVAARASGSAPVQLDARAMAAAARQADMLSGSVTAQSFVGDLESLPEENRRRLDDALKNDKFFRRKIDTAIQRGLTGGGKEAGFQRSMINEAIRGVAGFDARGAEDYVLSQTAEGRAFLRETASSRGASGIIGGVSTVDQELARSARENGGGGYYGFIKYGFRGTAAAAAGLRDILTASKAGSTGFALAETLQTPDQMAVAAALSRSGIDLGSGEDGQGFLARFAIEQKTKGLYQGKSGRELYELAATDLSKQLGLAEGVGTADTFIQLSRLQKGGVNLKEIAAAAARVEAGQGREEISRGLIGLTPEFNAAGLGGEFNTYVRAFGTSGRSEQLSAFQNLLRAVPGKLGGKQFAAGSTIAELQAAGAAYSKIGGRTVSDLTELSKLTGVGIGDIQAYFGGSKELTSRLTSLEKDGLTTEEQQEIIASTLSGRVGRAAREVTGQSVSKGQEAVNNEVIQTLQVFKKDMELLNTLNTDLVEQNRLNLQTAQALSGKPVVSTPGAIGN